MYQEANETLGALITRLHHFCAQLLRLGNITVKLYTYLFLHHDRAFSSHDLAQQIGDDRSNAWRDLIKLEAAGIVARKGVGRATRWYLKTYGE